MEMEKDVEKGSSEADDTTATAILPQVKEKAEAAVPARREFPNVFDKLPAFVSIGIGKRTEEDPLLVDLYDAKQDGKWLLIFTYPGNDFPYVVNSLVAILGTHEKFREIDVEIFVVVTFGSFSKQRQFVINRLGRKTGITFLIDDDGMISKKLGVLGKTAPDEDTKVSVEFAYPAYFLFTPSRELIQYCILNDPSEFISPWHHVLFQYPFNNAVLKLLISKIVNHIPIYWTLQKVKEKYGDITLKSLLQKVTERIKQRLQEKQAKRNSVQIKVVANNKKNNNKP